MHRLTEQLQGLDLATRAVKGKSSSSFKILGVYPLSARTLCPGTDWEAVRSAFKTSTADFQMQTGL